MGIIVSGIKLIKPAYDFCLQMAKKVDTRTLQREIEYTVRDCFYALRPLCSKYQKVCDMRDAYGNHELCIGEWFREKRGNWQKLGSPIEHTNSVFSIIKKYGDQVKPHVRKTIKKEFAELVDLAKQLQSYEDLTVKLDIPPTEVFEHDCLGGDEPSIAIESAVLIAVAIETQDPNVIFLFREGGKEPDSRELNDEKKTPLFEDIISYLVDLFKKADAEVSKVRNHNEKIMEQMKQIVAPLKIADSLKG
jgi:hypothetical protein